MGQGPQEVLQITGLAVTVICTYILLYWYLNPMTSGGNMDLLKLLQDLIANVSALQAQLADAELALAQAKQESYDAGFAAGVASVPKDKIYSQEELDAAVALAVQPLNEQISVLQGQIADLPNQIQMAVDAKLIEVVADYEASQVDDAAFLAKYKK